MVDVSEKREGLPVEVLQPWLDVVYKDRPKALEHYFKYILPSVLERMKESPDHHALRGAKYHTLISLMGFSPETTVISAWVVRPQRLLIVYGVPDDPVEREKVVLSINTALRFLTSSEHAFLQPVQVDKVEVRPIEPVDIYGRIRAAIEQAPTIDDDRSAIVDVTGGKKVMSATAGQAAWEVGIPLCYVDGQFNENLKRPWPGTERVIRLLNPSQQKQLHMRIDALGLYENRNYPLAVEAFDRCCQNRNETRLDDLAADLCRVYVRWTDLDLPNLKEDLARAESRTRNERSKSLFRERNQRIGAVREHLKCFEQVATAEPLAMIATYLELANLYASDAFHRYDFACLLVYRGMEAIVEYGLKNKNVFGEGFDCGDPQWPETKDNSLETSYVTLSRKVGGRHVETSLPSRVHFIQGLALLCLKSDLAAQMDMRDDNLIKDMRSLAELRNQSVLTHGDQTLSDENFKPMRKKAERLARAVLGDENDKVEDMREGLRPIDLAALHNPADH